MILSSKLRESKKRFNYSDHFLPREVRILHSELFFRFQLSGVKSEVIYSNNSIFL